MSRRLPAAACAGGQPWSGEISNRRRYRQNGCVVPRRSLKRGGGGCDMFAFGISHRLGSPLVGELTDRSLGRLGWAGLQSAVVSRRPVPGTWPRRRQKRSQRATAIAMPRSAAASGRALGPSSSRLASAPHRTSVAAWSAPAERTTGGCAISRPYRATNASLTHGYGGRIADV